MKYKATSQRITKFPKCGVLKVIQLPRNMIFSMIQHGQRDSNIRDHMHSKDPPMKHKTVIAKREQTQQNRDIQMDDVLAYSCLNNQFGAQFQQNAPDLIITNQLSSQNRQILSSQLQDQQGLYQIVGVANTDYCLQLDCQRVVAGNYGGDTFTTMTRYSYHLGQPTTQHVLPHKFISNAKRMSASKLAFAYNTDEGSLPNMASGICCYDMQIQSVIWDYSKRQQLLTYPVPISNSCLAIGHYFMNGNQFDLALHDVRQNTIASILDTSRDDFGGLADFPHFNMLYKLNDWELATVWGPPACSNSHIVKLDIRFPIRKHILIKNIAHPRFIYKSRLKANEYWVLRNQYQSYKYVRTVIESLEFE